MCLGISLGIYVFVNVLFVKKFKVVVLLLDVSQYYGVCNTVNMFVF